jgi:ubiquinone biosynthesis accessory factor UbiK
MAIGTRGICSIRASHRSSENQSVGGARRGARAVLERAARALRLARAMKMENRIDEIVRRLLESVTPALHGARQDLEQNFRAVLRANLSRLDLTSRDEFDAQSKLLERTRQRLEALESRVSELEAALAAARAPTSR